MKQAIILCQSQSDTEALLPAARVLVTESYQAVWLLYSPAVLVDTKAAEAEHQKNLEGLNAAIARCAAAEDFAGAAQYKVQRDAALLDRVGKVKDAWKAMPEFEQKEAEKKLFEPFIAALGENIAVRVQRLPDHYEPSQFIDALNSIRKGWHAPCVPPSFVLTWVSTLAGNATGQQTPTIKEVLNNLATEQPALAKAVEQIRSDIEAEKSTGKGNPMWSDARFLELKKMTIDQLGEAGIKAGVPPKEMQGTMAKIRQTIWKKEKANATTAPLEVSAY